MMENAVRTRLREKLEEIVFIELKKDIPVPGKTVRLKKGIPIPVPVKRLANRVTSGEYENLSVKEMIEGMVVLIASDPGFTHNEYYKRLLLGIDPDMSRVVTRTGIEHAEEDRLEEAFVCFETATILEDGNIDASYNEAKVCEALSRKTADVELAKAWEKEAFTRMERLTEEFKDFILPYYHLGFHYSNSGLYKKAELAWDHFLQNTDDENKMMEVQEMLLKIRDRIVFDEGYNEILSGSFKEGLEKLLGLEEMHKDWWNLLFFIGLGYRNTGDVEKAIEYFERVVLIKPDQTDSLNELGLCHSILGNAGEAARHFKKALNIEPNNPEILCNNAMIQLELGNYDLAESYLDRSMQIDPNDPVTMACMDELKKFKNN